ncbi:TetR/AcrR family transcriptional regulator [Pseudovibrio sp. Tun.PSC04-5.I4]|uniref:TetR/AcrR family transcriptional regulator n=1 Tax=Pseudovibrio sp. Tun.PSC04-5.I4 TaxID=1798213 RepID=UPI0008925416|nr:TetR/AcrR family transcriptional regulator [Pseudovibrio sp. Tun.PSC04-5.I4]SDR32209.1 DNA-binding transcriptional regulator, AcrR family [Pseudovibrio sp. Tun.PSC04-5.I4]
MKTNFDKKKALGVFAQYGFRKTSVGDVASAVGLSRQSLYKKFGSKEELFQTIITEYSEEIVAQAIKILEETANDSKSRILAALDTIIGQHVDLMRASIHGSELVQMSEQIMSSTGKGIMPKVMNKIAEIIIETHEDRTPEQAEDDAFILYTLAKGLSLTVATYAEYEAGIIRAADRLLD